MSDTDSPQVSSPASDASDDSDDGNASDSEKVQLSSSEAIHILCYKSIHYWDLIVFVHSPYVCATEAMLSFFIHLINPEVTLCDWH